MHKSAVLGLSSHSGKELFGGFLVQSVGEDIQNRMGFLGVFKSADMEGFRLVLRFLFFVGV